MTRINAFEGFKRAITFLSFRHRQDRKPAGHGGPAPGAVNEVKPAQGQNVPGGQPGGIGSLGWVSGNNGPTHCRHSGVHRLRTAPEKIPGTNGLNP